MSKRTHERVRGKVRRATEVLKWLSRMCGRDLLAAVHDGISDEDLLDMSRTPPLLPIDRGHRPFPELEVLERTGNLDRGHAPATLRLPDGVLGIREAYRLTPAGRRLVVLLRTANREETTRALIRALDLPDDEKSRNSWRRGDGDEGQDGEGAVERS